MNNINSDTETDKPKPPRKGDKVEVVRILILAVVSFVLGFALVIFFLGPSDNKLPDDLPAATGGADAVMDFSSASNDEAPASGAAASGSGYAPASGENPLLPSLGAGADKGNAEATAPIDEADAPAEVPPGRTPDGVALDGSAFYLKCWDKDGAETPGASCDKLTVLEKRFSTRLYVVDKCKKQHTKAGATGKFSLGVEVDFDNSSLSFWNGASSTLENAANVATCLRSELNGLPIHSVEHKFSRYRVFFTVVFGDEKATSSAKASSKTGGNAARLSKGKLVNVVMDRVRVRTSPKDGDVIGKISSGNQVKLLKKKGDWCQVLTPNNNEGWMICEALSK